MQTTAPIFLTAFALSFALANVTGCDRTAPHPAPGAASHPAAASASAAGGHDVTASDGAGDAATVTAVPARYTFAVRGMHCESCVAGITGEVAKLQGVEEVDVSLAEERAIVAVAAGGPGEGAVAHAIRRLGYEVAVTPQAVETVEANSAAAEGGEAPAEAVAPAAAGAE